MSSLQIGNVHLRFISLLQTSVKMKLLCVQVVKKLLGSEIDVRSYSLILMYHSNVVVVKALFHDGDHVTFIA